MQGRIHLILSPRERDALQARANADGESLSAWIRTAARQRLEREAPRRLVTVADLDAVFAACQEREVGREPDWEEHLAVAARSRSGGVPAT